MKRLVTKTKKTMFNPFSLLFIALLLLVGTTANAQEHKLSTINEAEHFEGQNANYVNELNEIASKYPDAKYSYNFDNGQLKDVTVSGIDEPMTKKRVEVVIFNLKNNKLKGEAKQLGVFYTLDKKPRFKNGEEALEETIQNNLNYPKDDLNWGVEGTVYVKFVIDENGKIAYTTTSDQLNTNNKMYKAEMEKSAINAVKATSGEWIPGQDNGVNVASLAVVPIKFKEELNPSLSEWVE